MDAPNQNAIAWIDLETTGLDPDTGHVLEVGVIVTTNDLVELDSASSIVVPADPDWEAAMDDFVTDMHAASGLIDEIRVQRFAGSAPMYSLNKVDGLMADRLRSFTRKGPVILGGNSITFDRAWMVKHLPETFDQLHYRSMDMTSVTQFATRVLECDLDLKSKSESKHRSLDDLRDSIASAKLVRDALAGDPF